MIGDRFLHAFDGDGAIVVLEHVAQHVLRERERDLASSQRGIRNQANQRSLELADIRLDLAGDVNRDIVGHRNAFSFRLALENGGFRFEVG